MRFREVTWPKSAKIGRAWLPIHIFKVFNHLIIVLLQQLCFHRYHSRLPLSLPSVYYNTGTFSWLMLSLTSETFISNTLIQATVIAWSSKFHYLNSFTWSYLCLTSYHVNQPEPGPHRCSASDISDFLLHVE